MKFLFLSLLLTFQAHANQYEMYKGSDCEIVLENISKNFLNNYRGPITDIINTGNYLSGDERVSLDLASLDLCGIEDLDQGSYDLDRKVTFCIDFIDQKGEHFSGAVYMLTHGDYFCEGESVKSYLGSWIH